MATWKWNTFTGLADDSFLWRLWEFLDCNNIDIIDSARYVDGKRHPSLWEIWINVWNNFTACRDGFYPTFASSNSTYIGFGFNSSQNDGWQTWAYLTEQIGTASLPVSYFFKNWFIRQQVYNGATMSFNSVITTNVPWIPTASCVGEAWKIYFAVANKIYVLDTVTTNPTIALSQVNSIAANKTIPFWYTIKYMYFYMDILNVVTTDGKNTTIYQLVVEANTVDVWVTRYYHTINGVICIWASGDWNNIYWFSNNSIYQSNGTQSIKVKTFWKGELSSGIFSPNAICTISEWIFKIADGTILWEYGHKKPWYDPILIKNTRLRQVTALSGRLEVYFDWTKTYGWRDNAYNIASYQDYSITSLPYEAWDFNQMKQNTAIRLGIVLPAYSTYTNPTNLCSINIKAITDEMEQRWVTVPVTIATIQTPISWVSERFIDIDTNTVIQAISNAWYNPDFQYIKLIIEWIRWDFTFSPEIGISLWTKTPRFFGLDLVHKDIRKWIPA